MSSIRLMVRGAAALAMLAVAAPALPCGGAKQTSATNDPPAVSKDTVASKTAAGEKSSTKGKTSTTKTKAATAAN